MYISCINIHRYVFKRFGALSMCDYTSVRKTISENIREDGSRSDAEVFLCFKFSLIANAHLMVTRKMTIEARKRAVQKPVNLIKFKDKNSKPK